MLGTKSALRRRVTVSSEHGKTTIRVAARNDGWCSG